MAELKNVDQVASGGGGDCAQGYNAAQEMSRKSATVADLTQEQLDGIFSEEDPHKQFEYFTGCLGLPRPESMSALSRITAEHDYLNVMFCREQNFTAEQTIAFRGITQRVFETGIVRGELDIDASFQDFTERVLSLAGDTDTALRNHRSPGNKPPATELTPGACSNGDVETGGETGGGSPPAAVTRKASGNPPRSNAGSRPKELVVDPNKTAGGKGDASVSPGGGDSGGGQTGDGGGNIKGGSGGIGGGGGGVEAGPVFSVGDVAAITLFVARGMYRNFALHRKCFEQEAEYCTEVRYVQVETPLEPPPLHEGELMA